MLNFPLYRLAFIPALLAAVIGAFSLTGIPSPLGAGATTQVFDSDGAASTARKLIRVAPDRSPGSAGDRAAADYVNQRLQSINAGAVATQRFQGSGDVGTLENVLITLPGTSDRTILLLAGRDADHVPAAASSAAATALLIELATELGGSEHTATLVLASVDGTTLGSAGTRQLVDGLPRRDALKTAIVISQPGASQRSQPLLVSSSAGTESASAQLVETAASLLATEGRQASDREGTLGDLARLAFPTGLGEQAPLIADGIDAIALSSAGEPPIAAARDGSDQLGKESIADAGRTATALVAALDRADGVEHGPGSYVRFAGNLVPGWTLALLALALLLPPTALVAEELGRQGRRRRGLAPLLGWVARACLPPLAALAALYALALLGLIARPPFPFDPGEIEIGVTELITLVFLLALSVGTAYLQRTWVIPAGCPRQSLAAVGGVLGAAACLLAWIANPYLALLLTPIPHVWVACCRRERGAGFAIAIAALAVLPLLAALVEVASALDWGGSAPWQLVLLVADGQIGLLPSLAFVLAFASLAASLLAIRAKPAAAARRRPEPTGPSSRVAAPVEPSVGPRG